MILVKEELGDNLFVDGLLEKIWDNIIFLILLFRFIEVLDLVLFLVWKLLVVFWD